jgi:integrase
MPQTGLQRREGSYYYRQKVPWDLRRHFGKHEIVLSLRTTKAREASARAYEQGHKWTREFIRIRAGGLGDIPRGQAEKDGLLEALNALPIEQATRRASERVTAPIQLRDIDDELISKICTSYVRDAIDADAEVRGNPGGHGNAHQLWSGLANTSLQELGSMLRASAVTPAVDKQLNEYLASHDFVTDAGVPGYGKLRVRFVEALIKTQQSIAARNEGRAIDTEAVAPLENTFKASGSAPGLTILGLQEHWATSPRRPKTADEFKSIAQKFQDFTVGRFRISQAASATKAHFVAYRKYLYKSGLSEKTVTKKLATIKALFSLATEDELLESSPIASATVKHNKSTTGSVRKIPFDPNDLKKIFNDEIYQHGASDRARKRPSDFWIPLIALQGMRIEEISQLRVADIRQCQRGSFFSVRDEEGQQLKNEGSRRAVPIHATLVKCGFMRYVQELKKAKQEWLFPDLTRDKYGKASSNFGKRWNRRLHKLLKHPKGNRAVKTFNSFRHLFKRLCRACDIKEDVQDALTGHRSGGNPVARNYGGPDFPEDPLFDAVKRFKVPDLDLSHLYAGPWARK